MSPWYPIGPSYTAVPAGILISYIVLILEIPVNSPVVSIHYGFTAESILICATEFGLYLVKYLPIRIWFKFH